MCKSIKFHQRWRYHCHKDTKECGGTDHAPSTERPKKLSFWNFSGTNPYFRTTLEQYSAVHFGSVSFFLAAFELIFSMLVLRHRPTQVKMVKSSSVPPHSSSSPPSASLCVGPPAESAIASFPKSGSPLTGEVAPACSFCCSSCRLSLLLVQQQQEAHL